MAPRQRTTVQRRSLSSPVDNTNNHRNSNDGNNASGTAGIKRNGDLKKSELLSSSPATPTQTAADIARDWHDYYNLLALPVIVATTMMNYEIHLSKSSIVFHGEHFYLNWAATLLYFLVDLIWVVRVPICVKSPGIIVKHHIAAMFYLLGPIIWPEYRSFVGSILSVEINTFFLIARRVVYHVSLPMSSFIQKFVSTMFYLTWVWIRVFVYPDILVTFLKMAVDRVQETQVLFHWEMIFIVAHAVLCVLNFKWTYDLFRPIIKRWMGTEKTIEIQSGL